MPADPTDVRFGSKADAYLALCDGRFAPINRHSPFAVKRDAFPVIDKKFPVPISGNPSKEASCFNAFVQAGRARFEEIPCNFPGNREFALPRQVHSSLSAQPY
jgi:hypothetical protein